ncbi:MAG TPA: CPBP family glutamic-type intramembrane protease, partial [Chryseolinea sp.]|nr:CPBP family glutamic-type intramembrane protease [Chryseolinea sp.]
MLTILLNVVLGFVIVGPILGLGISSLFYDGDLLKDFQNPDQHPGVIGPILLTQSIATFVGLILFPVIHITAIERKRIAPFFPLQKKTLLILILASLLGLSFIISISPLVEWNMNMKFPEFMKDFEIWARQEEDRLTKLTEAMTKFASVSDLLIGLVVIALLPAIGEELVFRGLIQNEFFRGTRNIHFSI